jgi:hypothetical protein
VTRRKKTLKKKTYNNDNNFNIKYWFEMYNRGLGLAAGNELLAIEYANVIQKSWFKGVKQFNKLRKLAHNILKSFYEKYNIAKGSRKVYYRFTIFYVKNVIRDKKWDPKHVIDIFAKQGADRSILQELAQKLEEEISVE